MCGGEPEAYARAEPVMAAYARQMRLLGPSGSGQLTKMVNQICIAGVVQGLAEGLCLARGVRPGYRSGRRGDLQRRRAKLADGKSLQNHGSR